MTKGSRKTPRDQQKVKHVTPNNPPPHRRQTVSQSVGQPPSLPPPAPSQPAAPGNSSFFGHLKRMRDRHPSRCPIVRTLPYVEESDLTRRMCRASFFLTSYSFTLKRCSLALLHDGHTRTREHGSPYAGHRNGPVSHRRPSREQSQHCWKDPLLFLFSCTTFSSTFSGSPRYHDAIETTPSVQISSPQLQAAPHPKTTLKWMSSCQSSYPLRTVTRGEACRVYSSPRISLDHADTITPCNKTYTYTHTYRKQSDRQGKQIYMHPLHA